MKTPKSQEELESLTVHQLRSLDIDSQEDEERVQSLLNKKLQNGAVPSQVYRGDIPDITNKEDELKWQKVVDDRENALRPLDEETEVNLDDIPAKTEAEIEAEIATLEGKKEELVSN